MFINSHEIVGRNTLIRENGIKFDYGKEEKNKIQNVLVKKKIYF